MRINRFIGGIGVSAQRPGSWPSIVNRFGQFSNPERRRVGIGAGGRDDPQFRHFVGKPGITVVYRAAREWLVRVAIDEVFSHNQDQWISSTATSWSTMALMLASSAATGQNSAALSGRQLR